MLRAMALSKLAASFRSIEVSLERLNRWVLLGALRDGVRAEDLRASLSSAGLSSFSALEELYAWRDGTLVEGVSSVGDIHLFPGFYFLSHEDSIANYEAFVTDPRWHSTWLPIFANGGGDFYAVDLGVSEAPVRHFRIDEVDHPVEFESLPDMLNTVAEGFGRGVFYVDPEGYLEMNDLPFANLAAETNPSIAWWRS